MRQSVPPGTADRLDIPPPGPRGHEDCVVSWGTLPLAEGPLGVHTGGVCCGDLKPVPFVPLAQLLEQDW